MQDNIKSDRLGATGTRINIAIYTLAEGFHVLSVIHTFFRVGEIPLFCIIMISQQGLIFPRRWQPKAIGEAAPPLPLIAA